LVPAKKGASPKAPDGGHSTHAGAPLEGAAAAAPEDPPEVARDDDVETGLPEPLEALPEAAPADPALPPDPVPEARAAGAADWAEAAAEPAVEPLAPLPRLTTPARVTFPGVAAVCPKVGRAPAMANSDA
jgi:hypothetical protein